MSIKRTVDMRHEIDMNERFVWSVQRIVCRVCLPVNLMILRP